MRASFVDEEIIEQTFSGRTVAIVGSAPSVTRNPPSLVDSFDVVVRVNNYKLVPGTGKRTDVHYSYYGNAIKKTAAELRNDGVRLCMCKCPNSRPIESEWHVRHGKEVGIDFRYIYTMRQFFWFSKTFIPNDARFLRGFNLLGGHIPTTGFSALLDILDGNPAFVYLTGFDFFQSGIHNVDEAWKSGNPDDPIGHRPMLEWQWIRENREKSNLLFDEALTERAEEQ